MKILIVLLLSAALTGLCADGVKIDPAFPVYKPAPALQGKLTTVGSDSLAEEMKLWANLLHAAHPGVTIDIQAKGSNLSAQALVDGTSQFAYSGRPMPDSEIAMITKAWGYPPMRVLVSGADLNKPTTTHPQVVWVNARNPLGALTLTQVDAIFSAERRRGGAKEITTWGELGLTGDWANAPIHKYSLNATGGPGTYVNQTLLLDGGWSKSVKDMREEKVIPEGVATDLYGIGVTGLPYGTSDVRALALAVNEGEAYILPTLPNILNRAYPLSRFNYIYVNKPPGKPLDPLIKELLHVALSREGQEAAVQAHFLPLTAEMLLQELTLIDRM
ncbi:MAG: substrate-binding domain-containing protein [Opitutaceae bacterium]